jgi:hypothetical protein
MLEDSDSLYALLTSQQGRYTLQESSISLHEPHRRHHLEPGSVASLGTVAVWHDSTGTSVR